MTGCPLWRVTALWQRELPRGCCDRPGRAATCGFSSCVIVPRRGGRLYTGDGGLPGGEGRLTVRKAWIVAIAAVGAGLSFVMLLVVGVYMVAGNLANGVGGGASGWPRAPCRPPTRRSCRSGATCAPPSIPRCSPPSCTRRAGSIRTRRAPPHAQGIAQFIPGTWATHGIDGDGDGDRDVWDPNDAIPSAASYDCELASYVKDVPGDPTRRTCSPPTTRGRTRVIKYGGVPPYKETQNYVKTITTLEKSFAAPVEPGRPLASRPPGPSTTRRRSSARPICGVATAPLTRADGSTARG